MGVSSICGVGIITFMDYAIEYLREKEMINFELKF